MDKITFKDNQEPALNAENLNQIQTNTENAIKVVQDAINTEKTNLNNLQKTLYKVMNLKEDGTIDTTKLYYFDPTTYQLKGKTSEGTFVDVFVE